MEAESNGDFSSLQPAKPTNMLKKTRRKGDGGGRDYGIEDVDWEKWQGDAGWQ